MSNTLFDFAREADVLRRQMADFKALGKPSSENDVLRHNMKALQERLEGCIAAHAWAMNDPADTSMARGVAIELDNIGVEAQRLAVMLTMFPISK